MKIAVLGGSFNPIHAGHAMLADTIIKELNFDKVIFVPAYNPPHKVINNYISPEHRLGMLNAFVAQEGNGKFEVEPCEIERGGVSYTVDTLEYLNQKYKLQGTDKLYFVMGDEVAAEFHKWYKPERIAELADFIITRRYPVFEGNIKGEDKKNTPSGDYKGDFKVPFSLEKFGHPCIYLQNPMLPVSSTEIRSRVKSGQSYKYLVPPSVFEYIEKENLYKN